MPRLRRALASAVALGAGFAAGWLFFRHSIPERDATTAGIVSLPPAPRSAASAEAGWDPSLGSPPRFVDATQAAGIAFRHENGMTGKCHYPEIMGGGVALFDSNGDGFLDIYLVTGNRLPPAEPSKEISNRLYRNNGDGTFLDVTERAGVGGAGYGQGACAADYDNDGDTDLFVSNYGPDVLYRNNGDGTFADVTAQAGVGDPGWGQSSSFFDFDGDGWLDLFVENYLAIVPALFEGSYVQVGSRRVLDYASPVAFQGSTNRLYKNRGDGTFSDVTDKAGLLRDGGKGMGTACADLDDDGRADVFVANDSMENYYFQSRGNGTFEEVGLAAGVAYDGDGVPEASMGVDVGDFDGDGRMDLIVPCLHRQVYSLYRNLGGRFADVSREAGLSEPTSKATGFNANFLDYDNDGDLDLFFTTGGVRMSELVPPEAPFIERYGAADILLANTGKGRFADVSRRAGPHFEKLTVGRGSAVGDLDNDGDLDLVLNNLAGRAVVLRNDSRSGHWIQIRLVPSSGNRDALGASVWVEADGKRQRAIVHGGVTYLSQNDRRVHFGLGPHSRVDTLELLWPSGARQTIRDLPADRLYRIEEGREPAR